MKIWLMVLSVVCADSAGNMAIRQGMKQVGDVTERQPGQAAGLVWRVLTNKMVGLGILCMAVAFSLFMTLLSRANLSFVLPATALSYVVNTLGARVVLKENVTAERWVGTLFICVGVALISLSPVIN